jgi:hypothetical protein
MNSHWEENDWQLLLWHIREGNCTPFLGAGAAVPTLRLGKDIANEWADEHRYPFPDRTNLPRVAQYIAVENDDLFTKTKMRDELKGRLLPLAEDDPHQILASLNCKLYLTTNYDDFMSEALRRARRTPIREHCRWYEALGLGFPEKQTLDIRDDAPVVYHLHGIAEKPNSIVITEEDYFNFLVVTSLYEQLIPAQVAGAFGDSLLLFLGYSLQDINFQVLFRRFAKQITTNKARHVAVQLSPGDAAQMKEGEAQRRYLQKQLNGHRVKVFWGTCAEFCQILRDRYHADAS